ncbi:MAG: hypothetical protein JXR27_05290 [Paludibacteraceae bacterium]|nr:hypothetical protein [Paludibacteraceae bacterium]
MKVIYQSSEVCPTRYNIFCIEVVNAAFAKFIDIMSNKHLVLVLLFVLVLPVSAQTIVDSLVIEADETVVLQGNKTIDKLIVHADKVSTGQLVIESGVVQVNKLTYRFALKQAEWTMLSIPTDIHNLNDPAVSNLSSVGLTQNSGTSRYLIKKFDSQAYANLSQPWVQITTPELKGGEAYLFYVVTGSADMFNLEFYFNNLSFNQSAGPGRVLVDLDLQGREILKNYNIQINATNVKTNDLVIQVYNEPENVVIPVNHAEALHDANILFTEDNDGIRITLPDSQMSRVIITNKKMSKVFKTIEYVSPAVIRLNDLKPGTYRAIVAYGPATEIKTFKLSRSIFRR